MLNDTLIDYAMDNRTRRKPEWLKIRREHTPQYAGVRRALDDRGLCTICESGRCPNQSECWNRGTATFMILGDVCTRGCRFCATRTGRPLQVDADEPQRLSDAVCEMGLSYVVLTSVTRDDLPDGGARHWAECVRRVLADNPEVKVEVLIPDFGGDGACVDLVLEAGPVVVAHNMETVRRLTPEVRSGATYERSLAVLHYIYGKGAVAKTGIMVGLGETEAEVEELMSDVLAAGCRVLTIGQYLQPTSAQVPVVEYVEPVQFEKYREMALRMGFEMVESAPLVRSSYRAELALGMVLSGAKG